MTEMSRGTLNRRVAEFREHHPIGTHSYGHHLVQIIPDVPCEPRDLVDALKAALDERDALFDLQWRRSREADKLWQAAHPDRADVWPDLGELLGWLMSRMVTDELREAAKEAADTLAQLAVGVEKRAEAEVAERPGALVSPVVQILAGALRTKADRITRALEG